MTRTLPSALAQAKELVTPALREAVESLHPQLRLVSSYHFGWLESDGTPTSGNGGKSVRPALCLLSAQAAGAAPEVGLPGAVAVELIHNFSILHDDVMDRDRERRHRPTAWALFGEPTAILAGDALFALASDVLLAAPSGIDGVQALRRLTKDTTSLIWGQAEDLSFEHRLDVSLDECLSMCAGKTGALLSCASSIGAILAGADEATVDAMSSYGWHLGIAFQAVDDLLGIWGRPQTTGKPAANDLRQRKKSLPVAAAFQSVRHSADLATLLRAEQLSETDVQRAVEVLESAGAREAVTAIADRELRLALESLHREPIQERARAELADIARFVVEREF